VHTPNQLMVLVGDVRAWRFPVAGRPVVAASAPASYVEVPVLGLSEHWGTSIHRPHDEVVSMLAVGVCGEEEAGSCDSCSTGGSGASGCGDSSRSAECNAGSYACCNCPGSCHCCSDQQNAAAKK
jgi:hypothetical protein